MRIELLNTTDTLLQVIGNPAARRKNVAVVYRAALMSSKDPEWSVVNKAIMERWSISGLEWIKRLAWKGIDG